MNKSTIKRWTPEEEAILSKNLKVYPLKIDAIRKTAQKIGRTEAAVAFHAQPKRSRKVDTIQVKNRELPIITYHNGTTRKAEVLVNNKDIIVAKFDDVVITIQF